MSTATETGVTRRPFVFSEPSPGIEPGTSSFAYTPFYIKRYMGTRLYLAHVISDEASLVSRSGPS
jgi:hypothetical protein